MTFSIIASVKSWDNYSDLCYKIHFFAYLNLCLHGALVPSLLSSSVYIWQGRSSEVHVTAWERGELICLERNINMPCFKRLTCIILYYIWSYIITDSLKLINLVTDLSFCTFWHTLWSFCRSTVLMDSILSRTPCSPLLRHEMVFTKVVTSFKILKSHIA